MSAGVDPLTPALRQALASLQWQADGGPVMLGLAGPPGAGKSTAAIALAAALDRSVVVPMDGFHLAQRELERLGRAGRKGAPDTFDAAGYVALLSRIRDRVLPETVYAPEFRRELEEPVAGAIAVAADAEWIITEGNYLLLDGYGFGGVRNLLHAVWYLDLDEPTRLERLVGRHVAHGRSPQDARTWVESSDEPNARQIERTRHRAAGLLRQVGAGRWDFTPAR